MLFACSAVANALEIHKINYTIYGVDYMPVVKVRPVFEQPDPIHNPDDKSMISLIYSDLSSSVRILKTSETDRKSIENRRFLRKIAVTHINFQEKKFAVGVYGNINYLNQDF